MTTAILILLYFALLVFALMAAYEMSPPDWHTGFDGFVKILTIAVTVVSAFMTALVGIINFDRSAKLSKELIGEKLEAAKKLERWKSNLTEENEAYGELLAAATTAYYTLAKLESSNWKKTDKTKVDSEMTAASGKTAQLRDSASGELWHKIWQRANYIAESADSISKVEQSPLWRNEADSFGALVQQFNRIVAEKRYPVDPGRTA